MSKIKTLEEVDAIVVGSGAAGSVLAAKLAQGGRQVLILEAGPEVSPGDMYSSQIWARRLKWGGSPVIEKGAQPIVHGINAGWGTGGAATHHYGTWPRMHENDFAVKSQSLFHIWFHPHDFNAQPSRSLSEFEDVLRSAATYIERGLLTNHTMGELASELGQGRPD